MASAMPIDQQFLERACAGDGDAFRALTEPYRPELQLHCYRMLGSLQDAEDVLQETLFAAWRGLEQFERRASLRAWLYRIATNRCLNVRRTRARRPRKEEPPIAALEPTRRGEPVWLEPFPDTLLEGIADRAPGPDVRYESRESVGLAFVAALQHLPPRQRAALVLREVLGFHTDEVADMLDCSEASIKGALQRARATLGVRLAARGTVSAAVPNSDRERDLANHFAIAVERGDVEALVALLTGDAWLTMPPQPYAIQGRASIGRFLRERFGSLRGSLKLVPTCANRQPAFGCYTWDSYERVAHFYGLLVITVAGATISAIAWFGDRDLHRRFGLPPALGG